MKRICIAATVCFFTLAGCGSPPQQQRQPPAQEPTVTAPPMFTPEPEETATEPPMFVPEEMFDPKPTEVQLPMFQPPEVQTASALKVTKGTSGGKPVKLEKTKLQGIPLYKLVLNLDDPQTFITVALPHDAPQANSADSTFGDEEFSSFVKRLHGAMMANGTFFSKDDQKRVMGNMVCEGKFKKYSQWENYGTTLGIKQDNELEMVTARNEGQPKWDDYWFSLTCGPRLLKDGVPAVDAPSEGFQDSHVLTIGPRAAIGFNRKKRQIIYCAFLRGLSLEKEAELMKAAGCDEAMNLDGGASRALAADGNVVIKAGRPLTNVLVIYDTKHPAPTHVLASWQRFQQGQRPEVP